MLLSTTCMPRGVDAGPRHYCLALAPGLLLRGICTELIDVWHFVHSKDALTAGRAP